MYLISKNSNKQHTHIYTYVYIDIHVYVCVCVCVCVCISFQRIPIESPHPTRSTTIVMWLLLHDYTWTYGFVWGCWDLLCSSAFLFYFIAHLLLCSSAGDICSCGLIMSADWGDSSSLSLSLSLPLSLYIYIHSYQNAPPHTSARSPCPCSFARCARCQTSAYPAAVTQLLLFSGGSNWYVRMHLRGCRRFWNEKYKCNIWKR